MTSHSISVLISVTLTFGSKDNRGDVAALLFLPFFGPPLATEKDFISSLSKLRFFEFSNLPSHTKRVTDLDKLYSVKFASDGLVFGSSQFLCYFPCCLKL